MSAPDPSKQRGEARLWLAKADEDLSAIRLCLERHPPLLGVAAYHCQQAAEKLIEALLVVAARPFRKTHDLDELSEVAVPIYPELEEPLAHVRMRTYSGFAFRYPMPGETAGQEPPSAAEIEETLMRLSELRARAETATGQAAAG